jgi:hypothetical protein
MISTADVLSEFVFSLDDYVLETVAENGISFRCGHLYGLKFTLATIPMWGLESGHVGLVVTKDGYPKLDSCFRLEDPELFDKINKRLSAWTKAEPYRGIGPGPRPGYFTPYTRQS